MVLEQPALNNKALTFEQLHEYTGFAKSYLYKLNMAGKIPGASKPGGKKLFYDREKIDQWLLGAPLMTDQEKEIAASTYISKNRG